MTEFPRRGFRRGFFRAALALILFVPLLWTGCRRRAEENAAAGSPPLPQRIVSMVPSVTETLFALGVGGRVVGVSDFCRYPPEAQKLPKLGGLYNPNTERILELRPDLAVLLREHRELNEKLTQAGIPTLEVDHASVEGILKSFESIAQRCGVPDAGRELRRQSEARLAALRVVQTGKPLSVLMVLDRDLGERQITQVYAAGKNRYFNDLLRLAGAENVLAETPSPVPTVSREGIIDSNPDAIVDLSSLGAADWQNADEIAEIYRRDWESLGSGVTAVRAGRIYPVLVDYATIPGPRFVDFAELLAEILHSRDGEESGQKGAD